VGGQAVAAGNEDAPGQLQKAEQEAEEIESEEEESEDVESEDTESDEGSEDTTEAEAEEGSDDDDGEAEQQFRSSSDDSGSSSRKSSDSSSGSTTRSSSSDDDEDDPNFVESAEDCPNEANRFGEFTGNGANDSGAYDSTCDGRESENGNGNGSASGRPCMGCVGNADNKNPPGQFPDGSDSNNGYECDGNNGVGKGNPAHTDCVEPEDVRKPPKTCPDGRPMPPSGICDEPVKRPPLPDVIKRPSVPPDRVLPRVPFARPPEVPKFVPRRRVSGVLPVTGPSQLLPFIWVAMSLIAAGIAALMSTRRRKELGARDW
jgi:LPXTG-motif cell wall-anchored protein